MVFPIIVVSLPVIRFGSGVVEAQFKIGNSLGHPARSASSVCILVSIASIQKVAKQVVVVWS